MTTYDKGDTARLTVTFTDSAGAPVDPTVVKFRAVDPAGIVTNWTYPAATQVTKPSTGVYVAALPLPTAGAWSYYWTNEAGTVEDGEFVVTMLSTERTQGQQIARRLLANMVSAGTEPVLDAAALDDLLTLASIPDTLGLAATDTGWTATYDLNYAAAEGWRWKAAKAASSYAFTMDGDSPERSFLMIRCEHMAASYARKIATSVPLSTGRQLPSYIPLI